MSTSSAASDSAPVPFCGCGFLPVPLTSARVSVLCVPARDFARCHSTTRLTKSGLGTHESVRGKHSEAGAPHFLVEDFRMQRDRANRFAREIDDRNLQVLGLQADDGTLQHFRHRSLARHALLHRPDDAALALLLVSTQMSDRNRLHRSPLRAERRPQNRPNRGRAIDRRPQSKQTRRSAARGGARRRAEAERAPSRSRKHCSSNTDPWSMSISPPDQNRRG
jgi:hypothetical protein